MKNFTRRNLTAVLIGLAATAIAQSPRMCVVEEATQASCPPCAAANPGLHSLMEANSTKAIFIAYQVWWPGVDAMYDDNTSEVDSRIGDYYSDITGAPNVVMNGSSGAHSVSYVTQTRINNTYAEAADFDMDVAGAINGNTLTITGNVSANEAVSGNLKLRLVITEQLIHTADLAFNGTNGETEFKHVFKKFVNGPAGITLSNSWNAGDTYAINESFDLSSLNIYDYSQLEVVALVQDDDDKFIHQAARDSEIGITVDNAINVGAATIAGLPATVCSGTQTISPLFKIQNTGNDVLTSATVTYNVNGGADQTYDWTGSLTTFQKDEIALPAISFTAMATNVLNVTVSDPNGVTDPDASDDVAVSEPFDLAATSTNSVTVKVRTDGYGDETYWEIRNSSNDVIAHGGNPNVGVTNFGTGNFPPPSSPDSYSNNTLYTTEVPVTESDCYTFEITDYYGDGMLGTVAYYKVLDNSNVEIINGGGSFEDVKGVYDGMYVVGIDELVAPNSFSLFPNPVSDIATLSFDLKNNAHGFVEVTALTGQTVLAQDLGNIAAGAQTKKMDLSTLVNGIYMVRLTLNDQVVNTKVTVAR